MKILLVNKFHYHKGGSETYYFSIADALVKLGHEVCFFSMNDEKNLLCKDSKYFVSKSSFNCSVSEKLKMLSHIAYSKEAYRKITELLKVENPSLVILNLVHKQITCSIIDAIKEFNSKIKILWIMHDLIFLCPNYMMLDSKGNICEKCLDGNFNHCVEEKCVKNSKLFSKISRYEAKYIKKHDYYNKVDAFICPSRFYEKLLKKSNSINTRVVYLMNPLPMDTKFELSLSNDNYMLYFGRLSKEKGVIDLLKSIKNINYSFIIAGDGPDKEFLQKYANDNNICNVIFKGYQKHDSLEELIKKSRAVIIPSKWYENCPYSALETMSYGKPLIVSNMGGLEELVINSYNGYVFKDASELPCVIDNMINLDDLKYKTMCNNSFLFAKEHCNMEKYINNLLNITKE